MGQFGGMGLGRRWGCWVKPECWGFPRREKRVWARGAQRVQGGALRTYREIKKRPGKVALNMALFTIGVMTGIS